MRIPNNDYRHWDDYLTNWPDYSTDEGCNEWLVWYDEWCDWPYGRLNQGDRELIELLAFGESVEAICERMRMTVEQFNGSCQYLFTSAKRFGAWKRKQLGRVLPGMTGFAQEVGPIICEPTTPRVPLIRPLEFKPVDDDRMSDEEILAFFQQRKSA